MNHAGDMIQIVWDDIPFHYAGIEIDEFVVMPNHVHALLRPLPKKRLEKILQSIKSFSSKRIDEPGQLWQNESYDTIIRDDEHFVRALEYITANPRKANLRIGAYHLFRGDSG